MFVFIIVTVFSPEWVSPPAAGPWAPGGASCWGLCSCPFSLLPPPPTLIRHTLQGPPGDTGVIPQRGTRLQWEGSPVCRGEVRGRKFESCLSHILFLVPVCRGSPASLGYLVALIYPPQCCCRMSLPRLILGLNYRLSCGPT